MGSPESGGEPGGGGFTPTECKKTTRKTAKPSKNSSRNRVSSHPLCQSMLIVPHVFQEDFLKRYRKPFYRGSRQRPRLLNDGVDVMAGQDGNHAPFPPH